MTEREVLQASALARRCGCTTLQLGTLRRVWRGQTCAEVAAEDGVGEQAIDHRLRRAIHRIVGYEADLLMRSRLATRYAARPLVRLLISGSWVIPSAMPCDSGRGVGGRDLPVIGSRAAGRRARRVPYVRAVSPGERG
jgi:hypothetical protein